MVMPIDFGFPQRRRRIAGKTLAQLIERYLMAAGACIEHKNLHASVWPDPLLDFRHVITVSLDIFLVFDQFITHELLEVGADALQFWHSIDDVGGEMKPIKRLHEGHVERRRGRALFLIYSNVQIRVAEPAISQSVYQTRVSVSGEHD